MFKRLLLAVSVSVVWSTTSATYFVDDSGGFSVLSDGEFASFSEPILQTNSDVDFNNGHHSIDIPQIPFHLFQQSQNSFPNSYKTSSSGRIQGNKGSTSKNTNDYPQNGANKQGYQNQNINQQQIEIDNDNYNVPQNKNQESYDTPETDTKILLVGGSNNDDYSGSIGQTETDTKTTQNSQYVKNVQTMQNLVQQKTINIGFEQSDAPKFINKNENPSYSKNGQSSYNTKNNHKHSIHNTNLRPNNNRRRLTHGLHIFAFPLIYNENPLHQSEYINLQSGNGRFTEIPNTYLPSGLYRKLHHFPSLYNSHAGIKINHDTPFLINSNYQGNFNDHEGILIGTNQEQEKNEYNSNRPQNNVQNKQIFSKESSFPNFPKSSDENPALNVEQKNEEVGLKTVSKETKGYASLESSGSEYKGMDDTDIPTYSDERNTGASINVEQKSLDVSLNKKLEQTSYEITQQKVSQYDETKSSIVPDYTTTSDKSSKTNVEQSPIQIEVKSSPKTEYDVERINYPTSKGSDSTVNTQQKSVDVSFKNGDIQTEYKTPGGSGSKYDGIGNIDATKYSNSNKGNSNTRLEQKPVGTGTQDIAKGGLNELSKSLKGFFSSPKTSYGSKNTGLNNYNRNSNSKSSYTPPIVQQQKINLGYPTSSGTSSNSYLNAGHPLSRNIDSGYSRRNNPLPYAGSRSSSPVRPSFRGNTYASSIGNIPHQPRNYLAQRESNPYGNSANYPRRNPSRSTYEPLRNTYGLNHPRPNSYISQSQLDVGGPKSPGLHTPNRYISQSQLSNSSPRSLNYQRPIRYTTQTQVDISGPKPSNYQRLNSYTTQSQIDISGPKPLNYQRPNSYTAQRQIDISGPKPLNYQRPNSYSTQSQIDISGPKSLNYQRPNSYTAQSQIDISDPKPLNYQRPNSHTAQSQIDISGPKPLNYPKPNSYLAQSRLNINSPRQSIYGGYSHSPRKSSASRASNSQKSELRGSSIPTYSDSQNAYENEKFVKISPEYPLKSLTTQENTYSSSPKQAPNDRKAHSDSNVFYETDSNKPASQGYSDTQTGTLSQSRTNDYSSKPSASTGSSYHLNTAGGIQSPGGSDYASGIGSADYKGTGDNSPFSASKADLYAPSHDSKILRTEDKPFTDVEDGLKIETAYPSGEEYKGIGDISSKPELKTEIVGGRRPIRKRVKTASGGTKSNPSGVKGKSEVQTEQKYLPITASLSDTKSDTPNSKSTKTEISGSAKGLAKSPDKTEQEQLEYEALLAGQGPQSNAQGSAGYGFNNPPVVSSGYGSDDPSYKDEDHPPMPYEFGYEIKDDEHGSEQYRQEKMNDDGFLTGRYGYKDGEGIFRQVEYEASKEGFKVNSIKTNEPGTDNQDPADVKFEVQNY